MARLIKIDDLFPDQIIEVSERGVQRLADNLYNARVVDTDDILKKLEEMYEGFCSDRDSVVCCVEYCNKFKSCVGCFYGRTIEIIKGAIE